MNPPFWPCCRDARRAITALVAVAWFVVLGIGQTQAEPPQTRGRDENADIRQWIAQLSSAKRADRDNAVKSLIAAGPRAMPEVLEALKSDDFEVHTRAELVAQALERRASEYLKNRGAIHVHDRHGYPRSVSVGELRLQPEDVHQLTCLYRLDDVLLHDTLIADELMVYLGRLSSVKGMYLSSPETTDEGLFFLTESRSLSSLKYFVLSDSRVKGRGLRALATIESLESITISDAPLETDALCDSVRAFQGKTLQNLAILRCPIRNDGMHAISRIKSLSGLSLSATSVSDEGLRSLRELPNLKRLSIGGTHFTDTAIRHVATCRSLVNVILDCPRVSPEGLVILRQIKTLDQLVLGSEAARFSLQDLKWLQGQLANIVVLALDRAQ